MSLPPAYPCLGVPIDGFCPSTPTYSARECVSGTSFWGSWYTGKPWPLGWGNALYWPDHARAAGFVVNTTWAPNSIMCLPPNHNGAGPKGHVAYVVGTSAPSQHVEVWEMNFLIPYGFDHRPALVTGCEYIHLVPKVPPPDPPSSGVTQMWLYQATIGTIWLVTGSLRVPLGTGADAEVFLAQGVKLYQQSSFTPAAQAEIAKIPIVS